MTARDLAERVCGARGVSFTVIRSKRRNRAVAWVRHEIWFILRERFEMSLPDIGRVTGGHDHTSVLHGWRRVELVCLERPWYRDELLAFANVISFAQACKEAA